MTDSNKEIEVINEKLEEEIKVENEANMLIEYADLAVQANTENKVLYQHKNGTYELIDQDIFATCKFDNGEWIEDQDKINLINESKIQANKDEYASRLNEANTTIAVMQDVIDLDMQESNEDEQLKYWKKYRILLTRVDTDQVDINWPEKPIS